VKPTRKRRRHTAKGIPELRRRFPGVPPIRVSSGTHSVRAFNRLDKMLSDLYDTGRLDYLRLLVDGAVTPLALLDRVRGKEYEKLPPPDEPTSAPKVQLLEEQVTAWQTERVGEVSDDQRKNDRWAWKHLLVHKLEDETVESVPARVRAERKRCREAKQFTAFNRIKAAALAFLRDCGYKRTKVYLDVLDIAVLPTAPKRAGMPLTPKEALAVAAALPEQSRRAWWTMCTTGMGPGELWGWWELEGGHIHIHGTKRHGRDRLVPLLSIPCRPMDGLTASMLRDQIEAATKGRVQPYDARRTYAKWLAMAKVISIHQDAYLGHGPKTMTELYQRGNERSYIEADAHRLREWLRVELGVAQAGEVSTEALEVVTAESRSPQPVILLAASTGVSMGDQFVAV